MENSAEALKMAFAVMVFVMALSIAIMTFSQARETADIVLTSSDATTFYEYDYSGNGQENRIVGMETIIPTLYRYSKENLMIRFAKNNGVCDTTTGKVTGDYKNLDILELYETNTNPDNWARAYKGYTDAEGNRISPSFSYKLNDDKRIDVKKISVIDLTEEQQRGESWTGSIESINKHLDESIIPHLTSNYGNKKFIELVGRRDERSGNKTTTKTFITYVLIN